jgi:hypothetical protein
MRATEAFVEGEQNLEVRIRGKGTQEMQDVHSRTHSGSTGRDSESPVGPGTREAQTVHAPCAECAALF